MTKEQQFTPVHGTTSARGDFTRNWSRLRPQVQERWPQLTEDDLEMIDGDARKLSALVQQRTGTELSEIEKDIEAMLKDESLGKARSEQKPASSGTANVDQDKHQEASHADRSSMADAAGRVGHAVSGGYQQVQRQVAAAPITSSGVAFATGTVIGLVIASLFKDTQSKSQRRHYFSRDFW